MLRLGSRRYDLTTRSLVMGVVNPAPTFDGLLRRAEQLVDDGAGILDAGGGEGVAALVGGLTARFDVPVCVATADARVFDAACDAGAVMGYDAGGFADPDCLGAAARHGATVVVAHTGLADTGLADADPLPGVIHSLGERAREARAAGIGDERIVLDAGIGRAATGAGDAVLLREGHRLAALGYPLMASVTGLRSPGAGGATGATRHETLAAVAYGVLGGWRIIRTGDVAATQRVARTLAWLAETAAGVPAGGRG